MGLFQEDDDCERPACDEVKSALPSSMAQFEKMKKKYEEEQQQQQQQQQQQIEKRTKANNNNNNNNNNDHQKSAAGADCPPGSAELGRGSWKLLHSMAAWYPELPTTQQRERMVGFFKTLADFYPCTYCASDFRDNLQKSPVKAESRTDLCLWLCQQHNDVNQKLGKPLFDCTMENLDERWRKSSKPECN
eukprot:CAMPEP_0172377482 /NCGR_PEP_ID=MMETSP1060-20121228/68927_1 /TAXON_ID=37318 /ORGANISM="Pseudo-nitzschia pungens, Strain cf. cingulata" /LENGTH=189 /DNA_ID=CAMNT_0013105169 /DNA_START=348 /DNA_END=917 /DNA_ORIENTATION=+